MSKFNKPGTNQTTNRCDYPAYSMTRKEELLTAVLTTMFGEPKHYGSTDCDLISLAIITASEDPEFLCRLACYARNVGNMRSVSHVLTAIIARYAHEYTRVTVRNTVNRPDDITELLSCYLSLFGKPLPNALKRETAAVIQSFDEYSLAKYNNQNKPMKLRDVLRLTHPNPASKEKEELFRRLLDNNLNTPYTWETELSAKGNTCEVWNQLIASGKVGYMALLRNLANILKSGADITPVLKKLSDPQEVKNSRQLPFRFYSAYRTLKSGNLMTPEVHEALETALRVSIDNMEHIPGRTLIAVDCSGSMCDTISRRGTIRCCDIGTLFGAMASYICDDSTVCYFDSESCSMFKGKQKGYLIARYEKSESILDICDKNSAAGGNTDLSLPMRYALKRDPLRETIPFDRVIYFSDNQCNSFKHGHYGIIANKFAEEYRDRYNSDFWVHGVDMQGYGTQQFIGPRTNLIAGWGESVLYFIMLAEKGIGTLAKTISEYPIV